ncbi:phage protein [Streptococcus pseudoporcinus]|nr:phage protein [Streptococcus pseudoporcinus]
MLAIVLLTVGLAPSAKAEEGDTEQTNQVSSQETLKWELDPDQQKVTDNNGNAIPVTIDTDNKITITLPVGWSFWLKKDRENYNPISINNKIKEEYLKNNENSTDNQTNDNYRIPKAANTSPKIVTYKDKNQNMQLGAVYNDNQGSSGLLVNVKVDCPSKENQRLTIVLKSDEGIHAGSIFLRDSQTIRKEKEKIAKERHKQKEEEQKLAEEKRAEETYQNYIDYDNQQPWYKRWGDSIQGQWADFTGWLKG